MAYNSLSSPSEVDDDSNLRMAKILVLGDCGVGKTTFCAAICNNGGRHHESTIGVKLQLMNHIYRAGTTESRRETVALWDVGGQIVHRQASTVFIDGAHGVILVHDLTNSKSDDNLWQWLAMLDPEFSKKSSHVARPLASFLESAHIPVLIVGTKADLIQDRGQTSYGKQSPFERFSMDCTRPLIPGSTNNVILARFIDAAIDRIHVPSHDLKRRVIWPT